MTTARRGLGAENVRIYAGVEEPSPAICVLLVLSLLTAAAVAFVTLVLGVQALLTHL